MKAVVVCLVLLVLCFGLAQYNMCTLWRRELRSWNSSRLRYDSGSVKQEQTASMELIPLLKDAIQHHQVTKPTIHLIQIMEELRHPFFMFLCSNCDCDVCEKVINRRHWSPVETLIFHYILSRHGCRHGKSLVIDVGAHIGYFSLISASHGCRVASFEPNSAALRYLNLSKALNNFERIRLFSKDVCQGNIKAVDEQTDTWASNKLNSAQTLDANGSRSERAVGVDGTMLDSLIDEQVRILKIDAEGDEANVFAGAKNLIFNRRVNHVLVEVRQAGSPAERGLLWAIAKTGAYTHVYNWEEIVTPLPVPFRKFRLWNANIVDVTDIVHDGVSAAPLLHQNFWFCRHPLPWLQQL